MEEEKRVKKVGWDENSLLFHETKHKNDDHHDA